MKTGDLIKRLNIRYDVMTLKREWQVLKEHVDTTDLSNVQQIGLTHTRDCEDDNKWTQAVGSLFWEQNSHLVEKNFSVVNESLRELCPYIYQICHEVKHEYHIGRIRVMVMKPTSVYQMHHDFERRFHLPILSPKDSFYYVRLNENNFYNEEVLESAHGVGFHMKDDGFMYQIEASNSHTAVNPCTYDKHEDRVHIVFNECYIYT